MKKIRTLKNLVLQLLLVIVFSMAACSKNETEHNEGILPSFNEPDGIEYIDIPFNDCLCQVAEPEQLVIINSQEEFDSVFHGCAMPLEVNFSNKTLLCIYGYCTQCVIDTYARVDFNEDSSVTVTVTVELGDCLSAEPWYMAFVCDKIENIHNVSFVINTENITDLGDDYLVGSVIGYETCSNEVFGYLIKLNHPQIGEPILLYGEEMQNVVKTYSLPSRVLNIGETVRGTFNLITDSTRAIVCPHYYQIFHVPELEIIFQN